jgi:hypothetical protein
MDFRITDILTASLHCLAGQDRAVKNYGGRHPVRSVRTAVSPHRVDRSPAKNVWTVRGGGDRSHRPAPDRNFARVVHRQQQLVLPRTATATPLSEPKPVVGGGLSEKWSRSNSLPIDVPPDSARGRAGCVRVGSFEPTTHLPAEAIDGSLELVV